MAGIGDTIRSAVMDMVPGNAANKINAAVGGKNDGHTTSGMDAAMQAHADQQHPVNVPTKTRKDGSLVLMGDSDYGK